MATRSPLSGLGPASMVTPWFTRDDKPVRDGIYHVRLHPSWRTVPFEWRQSRWHVGTNGMFWRLPINLRLHPEFQWRGLAGPTACATELLQWIDAATTKPDSDLTVLAWTAEGFCCAYWDDSIPGWIACESGGSLLGVTHWTEPQGPQSTSR